LNELTKRILSGVILGALLLGDLWLGSWWYLALLLVGGALVFREYLRLVLKISPIFEVRALWVLFGTAYIALAMHGLWQTRANPFMGFFLALWLFLVVWATDVGAYLFGRLIGGPKIAPSISPSKTWAGLVGGIVSVAVVMNLMFLQIYKGAIPLSGLFVIGFLWGAPLAILAQAGDFFESWMKRRAGVKDSGTLIPGHGGLFDRVDGLLPVAIVFYSWIGEGLLR
jgi:phosphatidate cytidylyltransferase